MFRITICPGWAGVRPSRRTIPSGIYAVTVERISDGFLSWRPLIAGDLPMLADWLGEPQVARWWNQESTLEAVERDFGASTRGEEPGEDLLVLLDGRPIGLLQRSVICDYPRISRNSRQLSRCQPAPSSLTTSSRTQRCAVAVSDPA